MTGEHPAAQSGPTVDKRTVLGFSLEALGVLLVAAITVTGLYLGLKANVADAQARVGSAEVRIERLEQSRADQAVINQRMTDDLEHIRQTVDQTARDVKDLQQKVK